MRIVVLVTDAYGGSGGIAQYNRDLLDALSKEPRVQDIVCFPRIVACAPTSIPANVEFRMEAAKGKLRFMYETLALSDGPFDLIICGHINLLPVAQMLRLKFRAPVVLLVYGIDVWEPHRSVFPRMLAGRVDAVWSISEITRDKMRAWCPIPLEKFFVLPNAIDLGRYGPGPRSEALAERYRLSGRKVIMTLCRLPGRDRHKGVDEVLDVLPALIEREPSLSYLVAGDGEDRDRLERKAASLGLSERVIFTGFVDEAEKIAHYRLADAFVMPGRLEGFGFVFLEAMACGIPVVGSILDGGREALRSGALGRLVDPDNRVELEAAVLDALNMPRRVPDGLAYFSVPEFEKRVHAAFVDTIER